LITRTRVMSIVTVWDPAVDVDSDVESGVDCSSASD